MMLALWRSLRTMANQYINTTRGGRLGYLHRNCNFIWHGNSVECEGYPELGSQKRQ
jgi:hypothetical protein